MAHLQGIQSSKTLWCRILTEQEEHRTKKKAKPKMIPNHQLSSILRPGNGKAVFSSDH